jgi:hypothetical protein
MRVIEGTTHQVARAVVSPPGGSVELQQLLHIDEVPVVRDVHDLV